MKVNSDRDAAFTTVYMAGPTWVSGFELTEQPGWQENLQYWRAMQREFGMEVLGESPSEPRLVLVVWPSGDQVEIELRVAATPFVLSGILSAVTCQGAPKP